MTRSDITSIILFEALCSLTFQIPTAIDDTTIMAIINGTYDPS